MATQKPNPELQAILQPAVEWFQILEKLLRAHRMYSPGHATIHQFEDRLFESTCHILDTQNEFALAVKPYEFLFTEEPVYHNEDKQENISFRLHQDGLRFLTFHYGLARDELLDFIRILRTDFNSYEFCDDDIVTLLWKANFKNISYIVVETFIESGKETEDMEVTLSRMTQIHMETQGPSSIADRLGQLNPVTRRRIKRQDAEMIKQLPDYDISSIEMDSEGVHSLASTMSDENDVMIQRMLLVLFRVLLGEEKENDFRDVATVVQKLTESLIRLGRFQLAAKVFSKLSQLSDPKNNPSGTNAKFMLELFQTLNSSETIKKTLEDLKQSKWNELTGIEPFLHSLGSTSVPLLFEWFKESTDRQTREHLIPLLANHGPKLSGSFSQALRSSPPDIAIDILRLLATMGVNQTIHQIRRGFSHKDPSVRIFTLDLLAKAEQEQGLSILFSGLVDSNKNVRLRALQFIVETRNRKASKKIFELVERPEFSERDGDEKRFFYLALVRLGGTQLMGYFEDQLGSVLSRTEKAQEKTIAAIWALHALGTEKAKKAIEKERDRTLTPANVKEACQLALKKWTSRSSA